MPGKLVRVNGRLVQLPEDNIPRDPTPKTIKWKGVPMLRAHGFRSAVGQGVDAIHNTPLISHNVTGMQGSGKSSLVRSIAHATHKIAKRDYNINFQVFHWGAKELHDVENALKTITSDAIISFDDISYEHRDLTPKELNAVLKAVTTIRHREGVGKDTRTILIYTSHYSKSIPTLLRSADYVWVLNCNSDIERENINKIFGGGYKDKLWEFYRMRHDALDNMYKKEGKFPRGAKKKDTHEARWGPVGPNTPKGKKPKPMYAWRDPFGPVLFFGNRPRTIAYPSREWMDAHCGICGDDDQKTKYTKSDISDMIQPIMDTYGSGGITGVKAFLSKHNEWSFSANSGKAYRRLEKMFDDGVTVQNIKDWFDDYNKTKSDRRREAQS